MAYEKQMLKRRIGLLVLVTFVLSVVVFDFVRLDESKASVLPYMPLPAELIGKTDRFDPVVLRGLQIDTSNPFVLEFIIDDGNSKLPEKLLNNEINRLIRYFLSALTVPEEDLWVNLSPYESDRIIPPVLGETDLGRDLLGEDYVLKQLTSSFTHPESDLGKKYWKQLSLSSTASVADAFNKVWIVPDKAVVYHEAGKAIVGDASLAVLSDADYYARQKNNLSVNDSPVTSNLDLLIPDISQEVNHGKHFARLRQIYNAIILAAWFKQKVSDSIYERIYVDKNKIHGIELDDKTIKDRIYKQYVDAFNKGAYDLLRTDITEDGSIVGHKQKRRFFSGGAKFVDLSASALVQLPLGEAGSVPASRATKVVLYSDSSASSLLKNLDPLTEATKLEKVYLDDIERARDKGHIKILGDIDVNKWAFYGEGNGLIGTNSRKIFSLGADMYQIILANAKSKVAVLSMGAGSGRQLGDMSLMAEQNFGKELFLDNVSIDAITLAPVSPLYRLRSDSAQSSETSEPLRKLRRKAQAVYGEKYPFNTDSPAVPLNEALFLDKYFSDHDTQVFDRMHEPFIRKQYISKFENEKLNIKGKYDFIYDYYDGYHYAMDDSDTAQKNRRKIQKKFYSLLSKNGIAVVVKPPWISPQDNLPRDIIIMQDGGVGAEYIIKKGSKWEKALRSYLKQCDVYRQRHAVDINKVFAIMQNLSSGINEVVASSSISLQGPNGEVSSNYQESMTKYLQDKASAETSADTVINFFEAIENFKTEERSYVGQWEKDYVAYLTNLTEEELNAEWIKRTEGATPNDLYSATVSEIQREIRQVAHFESLSVLEQLGYMFESKKFKGGPDFKKTVIEVTARRAILIEWIARHWSQTPLFDTKQAWGKDETIIPDYSIALKEIDNKKNRKDSERPIYKIISIINDEDVQNVINFKGSSSTVINSNDRSELRKLTRQEVEKIESNDSWKTLGANNITQNIKSQFGGVDFARVGIVESTTSSSALNFPDIEMLIDEDSFRGFQFTVISSRTIKKDSQDNKLFSDA